MRFSAKFILTGLSALGICSCVDKQYDLEVLDPEITILKTGMGYPLGYTMKRSLGELLELDLYTSINEHRLWQEPAGPRQVVSK